MPLPIRWINQQRNRLAERHFRKFVTFPLRLPERRSKMMIFRFTTHTGFCADRLCRETSIARKCRASAAKSQCLEIAEVTGCEAAPTRAERAPLRTA
jgi:hypothetical protein